MQHKFRSVAFLLGQERDKMQKIETEHGIFTENTTTGQTAEQVYADWLVNKDKPPQPTEIEILKMEQAKANAEMINLMMSMLGGDM